MESIYNPYFEFCLNSKNRPRKRRAGVQDKIVAKIRETSAGNYGSIPQRKCRPKRPPLLHPVHPDGDHQLPPIAEHLLPPLDIAQTQGRQFHKLVHNITFKLINKK